MGVGARFVGWLNAIEAFNRATGTFGADLPFTQIDRGLVGAHLDGQASEDALGEGALIHWLVELAQRYTSVCEDPHQLYELELDLLVERPGGSTIKVLELNRADHRELMEALLERTGGLFTFVGAARHHLEPGSSRWLFEGRCNHLGQLRRCFFPRRSKWFDLEFIQELNRMLASAGLAIELRGAANEHLTVATFEALSLILQRERSAAPFEALMSLKSAPEPRPADPGWRPRDALELRLIQRLAERFSESKEPRAVVELLDRPGWETVHVQMPALLELLERARLNLET